MALLTIVILDGFVFAAVLFLLSVGLTLIFGVLRILNISHGGIYALGAYLGTYLALKILEVGLSPYLTYLMLLAGAVIIGVITGPLIERLFLRRVYGQAEAIQLLLTFSILLILDDLIKLIWGTAPLMVSTPSTLLGHVSVAGIPYTWYHFLLIGVSIVFGGALVWLVRGTRFGKIVVSVINDREISIAVGINVNRIYTLAFIYPGVYTGGPVRCPRRRRSRPNHCRGPGVRRGSGSAVLCRDRHRWHGEPGGRGSGVTLRWPRQSPGHSHLPGIRAGGGLRADAYRFNGQA